jgi:hypothetical protein
MDALHVSFADVGLLQAEGGWGDVPNTVTVTVTVYQGAHAMLFLCEDAEQA